MCTKLICASLLVITSSPALSQQADVGGRVAVQHMHQCTVTPGPDWQGVTSPIPSIGVVVKKNPHKRVAKPAPSRIDLELTASRPLTGDSVPTVSGYAINTKGTGTSSGRLGANSSAGATVACVSRSRDDPYAEDSARAASADMFLQMPRDARAAGWSCSVTGSEKSPQFVLTLLVPTILGQAERNQAPKTSTARAEWSWGASNSGSRRMSIVPHGSSNPGATQAACSSEAPGMQMKYDFVVEKVERA